MTFTPQTPCPTVLPALPAHLLPYRYQHLRPTPRARAWRRKFRHHSSSLRSVITAADVDRENEKVSESCAAVNDKRAVVDQFRSFALEILDESADGLGPEVEDGFEQLYRESTQILHSIDTVVAHISRLSSSSASAAYQHTAKVIDEDIEHLTDIFNELSRLISSSSPSDSDAEDD